MVTTVSKRKGRKKRSRKFSQAVLGKPAGVIQSRVQAARPEQFGVVSVDCAKDRSKWMFCDFYGKVLVPPTEVERAKAQLQLALVQLKEARDRHQIKDCIVCVEMTGPIYRAFRKAGFDTRIVHPFASSHYRLAEHGDVKTDDNDLVAIFRAAVNGFGLLEKEWSNVYRRMQILSRHRRDLVKKRSKLQCQIRHYLERCLPGYANLFPHSDLWKHATAITILTTLAEHGGTADTLVEAGISEVCQWLRTAGCRFQSRTVERVVAWASNAATGDPQSDVLRRVWLELLDDWQEKSGKSSS